MPTYPRADSEAQTGSNLRHPPRPAAAPRRDAADARLLVRQYRQAARTLFTKAELKAAAKLAAEVRQEWRTASAAAGGDAEQVARLKAAARRKLERQVVRALPNFRQGQALRKAFLRELAKLTPPAGRAASATPGRLAWGDPSWPGGGQTFTPPFPVFDVRTEDFHGFVVSDESFARPAIGHVVNNVVYEQDDSTSFLNGVFGVLTIAYVSNRASCGVGYNMPAAGRLEISVTARNHYNRVTYAVDDNFGFSSARVNVYVDLVVTLVRGTRLTQLRTPVLQAGLVSHGSDLSFSTSDIDTTTPYTATVVTDETFAANEAMQILAGTEVTVACRLDDMRAHVTGLLWWELQKLTVRPFVPAPVFELPRRSTPRRRSAE